MTKLEEQVVPTRRVKIDGEFFDWDDATEKVEIPRTMIDIWKGVPGSATQCMNAQACKRNANLFSHPVLAVCVVKSRVYIVDREDHAVRYFMSARDSALIHAHDTAAIGEVGILKLRPPGASKVKGKIHPSQKKAHAEKRDGSMTKTTLGSTTTKGTPKLKTVKIADIPKKKRNAPKHHGENARVLAAVGAGLRDAP